MNMEKTYFFLIPLWIYHKSLLLQFIDSPVFSPSVSWLANN